MDISFHYFAVKSIARAAGYEERKAQRIASYSQFIDDYNWYAHFLASNIPDYVKSTELDIVFNETLGIINPVTTGFSDFFDMATLILLRSQKFTVSPFHFIPQDKKSREEGDNRTVPATLNDNSYITNMLKKLKENWVKGNLEENEALMQMGSLFHTFADTYAHQLFTGFNNKSNSVEILSVIDNITDEDVTTKYKFWIDKWIKRIESIITIKMPTIGHMSIAHVPDLSHLSFSMRYQDLKGEKHTYQRSNTQVFVTACKELYHYIRSYLEPIGIPADMEWDELAEKLAAGFLIDASDELDKGEMEAVKKLIPHWSNIFPNYTYSYSSENIKKGFVLSSSNNTVRVEINGEEQNLFSSAYSEDFYRFNLYADRLLILLYGSHPRNLLSDNEYDNIKIDK